MLHAIILLFVITLNAHADEDSDYVAVLKSRSMDLQLILKNYGIRENDVKEITYGDECDGDYPRDKVPHRAVRFRAQKSLSTSAVKFPPETYITFCDGKLEFVSSLETLYLWGFPCAERLQANGIKDKPAEEVYYCNPAEELKVEGIVIPKGVVTYFRHGKLLCFNRAESSPDIKVGGVAIQLRKVYEIKNGKVIVSKNCSEGLFRKYSDD